MGSTATGSGRATPRAGSSPQQSCEVEGLVELTALDPDNEPVPRFKLTIEYAGTRYSGWQIQKNARTVQGEIDRAIRTVTGRRDFELYGSGRTDAGVHALAQVAHLDVSTTLPADDARAQTERRAAGRHQYSRRGRVPHRFHARHDAVARRYLYQIATRRTAFPSRSSGGSGSRSTSNGCATRRGVRRDEGLPLVRRIRLRQIQRAAPARPSSPSGPRSTLVLVERLDVLAADDLILIGIKDRTSSGRWCDASSACWLKSDGAGWIRRRPRCFSPNPRTRRRVSPRRPPGCSSSTCGIRATRETR